MKTTRITIFLLLVWQASYSQWSDDFSDGDFATNPSWIGNSADFIIESTELKLNAPPVSASTYLSTSSDIIDEATWQFSLRMDFNPSSNNYTRVFIVADRSDLSGSVNGYFVEVGGSKDEINLYRKDDLDEIKIVDGLDSRIDLPSVEVDIKVTRSKQGEWTLSSKLESESDWLVEGSGIDDTYISSAYFGVNCIYTSTRSTKFYFDDFVITGKPYFDNDIPEVDTVFTTSPHTVEIQFNEAIDSSSSSQLSKYILNGQFNPIQVFASDSSVEIEFANQLPVLNLVEIRGVKDLAGNEIDKTTYQFFYIDESPVLKGEIVINEIMADPSPPEGLPEVEYIELYNNSSKAINMTGWSLSDKSTSANLPPIVIPPDSLLIICESINQNNLKEYGNVLGLSQWPSLNNSGDQIILKDDNNEIIDLVEYSHSWYDDELKSYGGWSLELIDPKYGCRNNAAWTASTSPDGGTPGKENSVHRYLKDDEPPYIAEAYVMNSDSIIIRFNESLSDPAPIIELAEANLLSYSYSNLNHDEILVVVEPLLPRIWYTIVANNINDCAGNITNEDSRYIILPEAARFGDIVISELLFNPTSEGVDFIEVYNNSSKYISLSGWIMDSEGSEREIEGNSLLEPNSYRVYTSQPTIILNEYPGAKEEVIFQQDIPLMSNNSGHVVIKNKSGYVIDSARYEEEWHLQYLASFDGVSLERINFNEPGYHSSNWASAASTENYATPGYENSQTSINKPFESVSVQPKVIMPDANGVDDFTNIAMSNEMANSLVTITIFNVQGIPIKQIANNELVGANSNYTWDGTDRNGILVPLGHYIIVIESLPANGRTKTIRKKVVVATGF